ncbi:hypothetical protein OIDMADRAFT_181840 [Oidiodendron maius Zn]|uniref:Uncharacterized protein n=1 Tax=Oidiodendron maius (strain Zn) TaxID=913774 RepID=A0A0C3H546_OIDMZ|nr:hypothetical protein OIDMADRAFT_181840 [Oidiodendron maius Zn]
MFSPDKICASSAGPFRNIHDDNISSALVILFTIFSAIITASVRFLVLGYCFSPLPLSKPEQPTTTRCLHCQHTDALPPPTYSESESKSTSEALLAEAERRKSQRPSIARFVICTTLSIINIIAIVLLVFSIQSAVFCGVQSSTSKPPTSNQYVLDTTLMWTFFFGIPAAWASSGILCWAMWLRNLLGGPEAAERWPIQHNIPIIILAGVVFGPFAFVFFVLLGLVILVVFKYREFDLEGSDRNDDDQDDDDHGDDDQGDDDQDEIDLEDFDELESLQQGHQKVKELHLQQLQLKVEELERLSQIAQAENTLLRAQTMRY